MYFDFPTILVVATFVTGVIWGLDSLFLRRGREQRGASLRASGQVNEAQIQSITREPILVEYSRSFFPVILLVLLIRSFVAEPFRIPSGSMMPTLLVGDFILVNKYAYGIRLPVINRKVIELGTPQRGDVVVFRYPENPRIDYIKRVVGLPGDHIAYRNKTLYINGAVAPQESIGRYQGIGGGSVMTGAEQKREVLDGLEHEMLVDHRAPTYNYEWQVPAGQYFVMGDNRDNSRDSRYWGMVPDENLVGRAFFIWMNWDSATDGIVAWDRIGNHVE